MPHFNQDFVDFFNELRVNNNAEWFKANKDRFDNSVKKPLDALALDLQTELRKVNPDLPLAKASELVFRIYRDVRFSKNKLPYKDNLGMVFSEGGKKSGLPALYIHLSPGNQSFLAGGLWEPTPAQILAVRREISYNMKEFADIISDKAFVSRFGTVQGEANKKIPAEFQEDFKTQPLIANKQFLFNYNFPEKLLTSDKLIPETVAVYKDALPFVKFLQRGIGEVV
jgi:uncharacterized protein (TIGR02453 family)